jgi:exosome complex exonuclease RRP6
MDDAGPSNTNFDAYHGHLQTCALNTTRKAAVFPLDIAFHRSMDSDLADELDIFSQRVLSATNRVLNLIATVDQSHFGKSKGKAKVESQDDVVDNFYSLIVDATDLLLERTVRYLSSLISASTAKVTQDICLDNVLGKNKAPAIPIKAPVEESALRKVSLLGIYFLKFSRVISSETWRQDTRCTIWASKSSYSTCFHAPQATTII